MRTRPALRLVDVQVVDASTPTRPHGRRVPRGSTRPPTAEVSTGPGGGSFTLSVDHEGLTLHLAAVPSVVRHFAWRSVDTLDVAAEDHAPPTWRRGHRSNSRWTGRRCACRCRPSSFPGIAVRTRGHRRRRLPRIHAGRRLAARAAGTRPRATDSRSSATGLRRAVPVPGGPQDLRTQGTAGPARCRRPDRRTLAHDGEHLEDTGAPWGCGPAPNGVGGPTRATPLPAPATVPDDRRPVGTDFGHTGVGFAPFHPCDGPASPAPSPDPAHGHPPMLALSTPPATTTAAPVTPVGAVTPVTTKAPVTTVPTVATVNPVTTVPTVTTVNPVTTVPPVTTGTTTLQGGSPAADAPGPGVGYRPITLIGAIMQAGLGLARRRFLRH